MSKKLVDVYPSEPNALFQQTAYTICIHGKTQMTSPTIHIQGVESEIIESIKLILEENFVKISKEIDTLLQSKKVI